MKKKTFVLLLCIFLCGCGSVTEKDALKHEKQVLAMDTYMTLTAYGEQGEEAVEKAEKEIQRLDRLLSVSSREGEVYAANEKGSVHLSEDAAEILEASLQMFQETDGAFDITIFPLMKEWGFTDEKYQVPAQQTLEKLLEKVDASKLVYDKADHVLTLPEGMKIDFGGIAKGYASARVMKIFKECGVTSGIVSLGGNVQTCGKKPDGSLWKIAVQNPVKDAEDPYIGVLKSSEKAVVTSGGYERFFEENGKTYHHILDPKTGYPAESGLVSVTVVSGDGSLADGLSTSLFIMGKEKAVSFWKDRAGRFDMILQTEDGELFITEGIEREFSSDLKYEVIHE